MLQFYFLSVLFNLSAGFVLIFSTGANSDDEKKGAFSFSISQNILLVLGILTFGTGFFKLLTPLRGGIPIIGDIIPALAGLCGGFSLLLGYFITNSTNSGTISPSLTAVFISGKKYLGIFCLIAAVLHFLFPTVLFL